MKKLKYNKFEYGINKLKRGIVWCTECNNCKRVDINHCFSYGWPMCCNLTMTIDSPEERELNV